MDITIPLEKLIEEECIRQKKPDHQNSSLILDTNSFRYKIKPSNNTVIITEGVARELYKHSRVFNKRAITKFISQSNCKIILPEISPENEYEILKAIFDPKGVGHDIGWVDMEQISYAMQIAKEEKVTMVTNDDDILRTVKNLRKAHKCIKNNIICASIQRYIERKHSDIFIGLEEKARSTLLRGVNMLYEVAA